MSILEQDAKPHDQADHYYDTHEIATEFKQTYGRRKLERWARERNPATGTGMNCFDMTLSPNDWKPSAWPR